MIATQFPFPDARGKMRGNAEMQQSPTVNLQPYWNVDRPMPTELGLTTAQYYFGSPHFSTVRVDLTRDRGDGRTKSVSRMTACSTMAEAESSTV
jgi:hypothetical protein